MARKPQPQKQPKGEKKPRQKAPVADVYAPDDPTPAQIESARALAAHGIANPDIAIYLGKPEAWLTEKLGAVMTLARVQFNARLVQTISDVAFGRERKVQSVNKTRINAQGKEVEYVGQEVVQEARAPNPQVLLYLAKERLGWRDPGVPRGVDDAGQPVLNLTESLDYERLSDAEVEALDKLLQKIGYQPTAPAKPA